MLTSINKMDGQLPEGEFYTKSNMARESYEKVAEGSTECTELEDLTAKDIAVEIDTGPTSANMDSSKPHLRWFSRSITITNKASAVAVVKILTHPWKSQVSTAEGKAAASATGGELSGKVVFTNSSQIYQIVSLQPNSAPQSIRLLTSTSLLHLMKDTVVLDDQELFPVIGYFAVEAGYDYVIRNLDGPTVAYMKVDV